jgi:signal transduction histidine kinase
MLIKHKKSHLVVVAFQLETLQTEINCLKNFEATSSTQNSWLLEPVRNTPKHVLFRVLLAIGFALLINGLKLDYFEAYLYDFRVALGPAPASTGKTAQIIVDPSTVEHLKGPPTLAQHTQMLIALAKNDPFAVVYVTNPKDISGSDKEKAEFVAAAQLFKRFFIVTNDLEMRGEVGKLKMPPPFEALRLSPGPKSSDTTIFAKDGVSRRMMISYQDNLMLHPLLAREFNAEIKDIQNIRGIFDFMDSQQVFVDYSMTESVPKASFLNILEDKIESDFAKNKIVFVGQDLGTSTKDYIMTPYSREVTAMTLPEMHANMVDTLIRNNAPIRAPNWLDLIFIVLVSVITVHVVLTLSPLRGLLILSGTLLTFTLINVLSFWYFHFWLGMAHTFLAIFICYYFFIPYRLIIENRRSWEYYQKHKLLQQVEELKTNFIGMMSHDLRTPLARIQGMTEVMLQDENPLSTSQREALDTIQQSGKDQLHFINTILNYAKIESQGIELHLATKDINELIKEVVKKHEFLAKVKHIHVNLELEPMFSIKIDPELIKQVLSNIIENAIKYSPEKSSILISTEEKDNKVVIQVADQGLGIPSDELPNIFMKFFRSKNAKISPIKGSGLGLYLAKYFVNLHGGEISAESAIGQGSTFTVELPI